MLAFLFEVDKTLVASWGCVEDGRHLESTQGAANSVLECECGRVLGSPSRIGEEVREEASQANRASLGDHEGLDVFMVEQVVERGSGGPKESVAVGKRWSGARPTRRRQHRWPNRRQGGALVNR
eukprot:2888125-Pyramimonas_sp.AAC.1